VRFFSSRKCMAAEIMMKFNPLVPLTVHWDDKLLSDFTGHKSVMNGLPAVATVTEYNNCMACTECCLYYPLQTWLLVQSSKVLNKSPSTDWELFSMYSGYLKLLNFLMSHPSSDLCTVSRLLNTLNINSFHSPTKFLQPTNLTTYESNLCSVYV